ncbi:MAG: Kazal-type serine protease inhibitor domain-containing protein [Halioglobus sp.]
MYVMHRSTFSQSVARLVFSLACLLGISASASAASDYVVASSKSVTMGDQGKSKPRRVIEFQMPQNFDRNSDALIQMYIRSTDKSKYNAVYLNGFTLPDFDGCDSADKDRNKGSRIGYLPHVPNKQWIMYHKTVSGDRLRAGENEILICSRNKRGDGRGSLDKFYIKDIVVHFRETANEEPVASCSRVYEPVCGVNGRTYSNSCEADAAGFRVDYLGECSSSPGFCSTVFDPVCGADGNTYNNACEADAASVFVDHQGECNSGPTFCSSVFDPVCGVDGNTYNNACEADAAGVSVDFTGQCLVL